MKQMSLGAAGFDRKTKRTCKREFLDEMNLVVCWFELVALVTPQAPPGGARGGRPPFAVETMLRIHFLQQWFNLSDPAMEETLDDTPMFCEFAVLDMGEDHLPDESTILLFRHFPKAHHLSVRILATVNATLTAKGMLLKLGTVVDATLMAAPSSIKNKAGERDPEMQQTKKGNQWHIGIKAHSGVNADSGLVHSLATAAADAHDVTQAHALLQCEETDVFANSGYRGAEKRKEIQDQRPGMNWQIAMMPSKRRALDKDAPMGAILEKLEQTKARVRAKLKHLFRVIMRQFGFVKVKYRRLAKITANLLTLFALSNLWMARKRILNIVVQG